MSKVTKQVEAELARLGVRKDSKLLLAFSGGVDSAVLLDILGQIGYPNIVLAYYNHSLRRDSDRENLLVQNIAKKYQLKLIEARYSLTRSDEASLRKARHHFLDSSLVKSKADYLLLAHHQDDLIETIVANDLRGAGLKGYVPFKDSKTVIRPMINLTKNSLYKYAHLRELGFIEDYTNYQLDYQRNLYRWLLLPTLSAKDREKIIKQHQAIKRRIQDINQNLKHWTKLNLAYQDPMYRIDKSIIQALDRDFIIAWLDWLFNRGKLGFYSTRRLELMADWLKNTTNNKRFPVGNNWLVMQDGWLIFEGLTDMIENRISD
ncbi:tRNA lysidine(34) synthetase TilS [Candidatus Saccharibacteria bacterium]|nr:tRNA lysidine(34) synthetase TilS [Candidatus Saccharibacteria bacterium]MCB9834587.1 tRNA lysidine(34) synthetase TilS [Candidatus Nomurabacteria bacterium]